MLILIIPISFMEKIMNSPRLAWKMSGLFNTAELGLDDLLSPGIPNNFGSPGSWLSESDVSKFGNPLSHEEALAYAERSDSHDSSMISLPETLSNHLCESYDKSLPELLGDELDFDTEVNINGLINFPAGVNLPPSGFFESSSPNLFETFLLMNPVDTSEIETDDLDTKKAPINFKGNEGATGYLSNEIFGEIFLNESLSDLNDFLCGSIGPTMICITGEEAETVSRCSNSFSPDHSYSLKPLDDVKNDLKGPNSLSNFDYSAEKFVENNMDQSTPGEKGDIAVTHPMFETLNLSALDSKLLKQLLDGGSPLLDSEENSLTSVELSGSGAMKSDIKLGPNMKESTLHMVYKDASKFTEDELMEDVSEIDETRRKYLERRRKNNIASRRSREIRKLKYSEMEKRAMVLELENKRLKEKIAKMEMLSNQMKQTLIARLRRP